MRKTNGDHAESPPRPIPERIREAREGRGIAVEAFAERLGVSRQAVAQYETGQSTPSGDVLAKIIAITGQPPIFFMASPARVGDIGRPFWRSLKRMEQQDRRRIGRRLLWAADIAGFVSQFVQLPPVNLPEITFDAEKACDEDIELAAEALRDHWDLGRGPIRDLSTILEANGIILVREPVDCSDMDAVSCWQMGRPYVLYSAEVESGPRNAFNLAHELGHVVLHAGVEVSENNLPRIERQANRFAGAFLMPRERFSREVLGSSVGYFRSLKGRWGVAIAAMGYRSKDLGIFSSNQYSYLIRQMNSQGIRKKEPLDDAFPMPTPSVLGESIRMLLEHRVQTKDQIENALGLNLSDIECICGIPRGYLDVRVVPFKPRITTGNGSST